MNFWDQQFSVPDFRYGQQPNRFLQEQAVQLKPQSQALLNEASGHQGLAYLTRYDRRTLTLENTTARGEVAAVQMPEHFGAKDV